MTDTDRHPPPPGGFVFFSVATYALGKELGFEGARDAFLAMCKEPTPGDDTLPAARVVGRLQHIEQVALWHDCAATYIGKSRSRAFHEAIKSQADVWITCDDDVEADTQTLRWLVAAVRNAGVPCVVLAPCVTRGSNVVNVALERAPGRFRALPDGGKVVPCLAGGFGLVAMNRLAMNRLAEHYEQELSFLDDDGQTKIALFFEMLAPQKSRVVVPGRPVPRLWTGEDVSFCKRALDAGVKLEALVTGVTSHDGVVIHLECVPALGEIEPSPGLEIA